MPSPFVGMDPYLEDPAYWEGFHLLFIAECTYHLSDRLPDGYIANPSERVHLISLTDEAAEQYVPDVTLTKEPAAAPRRQGAPDDGGAVALAVEPINIPSVDSLEIREAYLEIQRLPDLEVVTSLELLSPSNKF